jgi:hypothetical protein
MSECQILVAAFRFELLNFLCVGAASSWRVVRPRCLKKRYRVAGAMAGESVPDTSASSRKRVMPVRCGFSRFRMRVIE